LCRRCTRIWVRDHQRPAAGSTRRLVAAPVPVPPVSGTRRRSPRTRAESIKQSLSAFPSLPESPPAADRVDLVARQPAANAFKLQRRSVIRTSPCISRQLDGRCGSTTGNKAGRNAGAPAALAFITAYEDREPSGRSTAMVDAIEGIERIRRQQAAYQPSGNGIKPQAVWLSLAARSGC
jgi:hypothetical protein